MALIASLSIARPAIAEDPPPVVWPDPGSEDPAGPKLFERRPTEEEYDEEAELTPELKRRVTGEPVYRWSWYGWRNLIGDATAVAVMLGGGAAGSPEVIAGGAALFAIGSPIAHLTKGNWGRSLISLGMRLAGPTLFGLGLGVGLCEAGGGCVTEIQILLLVLGGFFGGLAAAGLDIGLLARERVEVKPKVEVAPAISIVPDGPRTFGVSMSY